MRTRFGSLARGFLFRLFRPEQLAHLGEERLGLGMRILARKSGELLQHLALLLGQLLRHLDGHPHVLIAARVPRPPMKSLIDHIEHVARVAGVDHAGIGSDFDGIPSTPEGIDSAADLPKIASELRKRGFTQAEVAKVFSGNVLRVMRAAEKIAAGPSP